MIEAIVAGHVCLDVIPPFITQAGSSMLDYVTPGRLIEVGPVALSTGGAMSNTGLNLHRLGVETRLVGKIGDDLFGSAILEIIRQHGAELAQGMAVVPGEVSSYTVVVNPPGVDRAFLHCPGANRTFGFDDVRYDLVADTRLFHLGYPGLLARTYAEGGAELVRIFRRAKELGATTSLDMVMPDRSGPSGRVDWRALLYNVLPWVDLFVPSIEEMLCMLDRPRFEALDVSVGAANMLAAIEVQEIRAMAQDVLAWGAKVVMFKLGTRGIYLRTAARLEALGRGEPTDVATWQGRELWVAPFAPRQVVSTVGAGDAAIAGFLAAWLRGLGPLQALDMAAATGASCVEEAGAVRGVGDWQAMQQRLAAGWPRLPATVPDVGWSESTSGVWRGPADAEA